MTAVPAWPPRSLPRLYVPIPLAAGTVVPLDPAQANYLGNVMRLGVAAEVLLFDGASGEWLAHVAEVGKKSMLLIVERQTRSAEVLPDLWLAFAPVKRGPVEWLVEKATELGAARLMPVTTRRTVVERLRLDRLRTIAIEAAEQCGRTVLPTIDAPLSLDAFLQAREAGRTLYFADETGGAPVADALQPGPAALLVGPEGGFTAEERATIRGAPEVVAISLGPRILRAETAALAAVTAYMALAGDWR